jgi:Fur family iron response transcriptional regulator
MSLRSCSGFRPGGAARHDPTIPPPAQIGMSTRPYRHILETLQRAGLRPTRQRLALARLLFDGRDRHITAEQLHGEAVSHRVSVSLATVYNTLHQFTAAGLLREVVVDPGRSYFDTNITDHHHFYNEKTGDLLDIAELEVANLPAPPPGAKIARVDVVVRLAEED